MSSSLAKLLFSILYCVLMEAQVDTGAILGVIKDQTGAVIPGAQVTLKNEGTSQTALAQSGPDGSYTFTPVRIGFYALTVEAKGFQRVTHTGVEVEIQRHVVVNFVLAPSSVSESVSVSAQAPLLETQRGSIQQVINSRAINDLPLNGRNATFLAQLSAGVSFMQQDTRGLGASGGFAANGARPAQNNYMLDGIDNNAEIGDLINRTYYVVLPPPDALQEFTVQTSNYSAEFGHSAGAVLNATVKSGTNQVHGSLWEFLRNDKMDASDFFLNAAGKPKAEFRQNQFGFTLGGPVVIPRLYRGKNKAFFFADYQGTRIRQGNPYVVTVPTVPERNSGYTNFQDLITGQSGARTDLLGRVFPSGTIFDPATTRTVSNGTVDGVTGLRATGNGFARDPFYGASLAGVTSFTDPAVVALLNRIPAARLDASAIKLLNLYSLPSTGVLLSNFVVAPVNLDDRDSYDIRFDHNLSPRDTMFVRYSHSNTTNLFPGPFPGIADGSPNRPGSGITPASHSAFSETHLFSSTLVNEFRIGYSRLRDLRLQFGAEDLSDIPGKFGIPGVPQVTGNGGLPNFNITGLATLGSPNFLPDDKWSNTLQVMENLTKVAGTHSVRSGFEFQGIRFPMFGPPTARGSFSYSGVYTSIVNQTDGSTGRAQFLLTPRAASVPGGINNVGGMNQLQATNIRPFAEYRRVYLAGYVQDDWRVNPSLTLNLGLRYDWFGAPAEHYGAEANFQPGPSFQGGSFLIPESRKGEVPASFISLLAKDGVNLVAVPGTHGGVWQNPSSRDFGPRIGFAYRPARPLVIRGGYAIFYGGQENFGLSGHGANNFPFVIQPNFTAANAVTPLSPNNSVGLLSNGLLNVPLTASSPAVGRISLIGAQLDWKDAATQNYNLTLQVQLSSSTTASLAYVGSVTRHLHSTKSVNTVSRILPPGLDVFQHVPYPDFATGGSFQAADGNSNYNALQLNVERRFAGGLSLLGNYTFSKCLGDARDQLTNNIGGYRAPYLPGFGIRGDYGLCNFDVRNMIHFSGGYDLPFGAGRRFLNMGGPVNLILGGWSTHWSLTLQDGQPFSVGCTAATTTGLGCFALLVPGQDRYTGSHNVDQWMNPAAFANPPVARTIGQTDYAPLGGAPTQAAGPGFHRLDFSLFKRFKIREAGALEFRAEFFNLTNTPNFANPGSLNFIDTKNFARITSTRDNPNDPRQVQFALKFYF